MICKKCKKEYSDKFSFCPFCGTKSEAAPKFAPFTRLDWYSSYAGRNDAKMAWKELKNMSFEELERHLLEKKESFDVWAIKASYKVSVSDKRTARSDWRCGKHTYPTREDIIDIITATNAFDIDIYPEQRAVLKQDLKELDTPNGRVFYTREECQRVISATVAEAQNLRSEAGT